MIGGKSEVIDHFVSYGLGHLNLYIRICYNESGE
jgi:hypothetical protein